MPNSRALDCRIGTDELTEEQQALVTCQRLSGEHSVWSSVWRGKRLPKKLLQPNLEVRSQAITMKNYHECELAKEELKELLKVE
jgi:hypothetical protein